MLSNEASVSVTSVNVFTADYRGHTPEELANMTVDKIIYVGRNSHPAIIEQARAFRQNIYAVLVDAFKLAQESERTNIVGKLITSDQAEIASLIQKL